MSTMYYFVSRSEAGLPGGSDKPSPKSSLKIPPKIPKYRFSKYPKNPYIGDMKRRSKLGFKTLLTLIYFEKAENTLKLRFCRAVNQEAENNTDFKVQLVRLLGNKQNIFNILRRSCNTAQYFNILAQQIRKKFEILYFSKISKNLWGYP